MSLPEHLQQRPECLPLTAYSADAHSFFLIHTIWLQCHCDLYRFFIHGIREAVSVTATNNTLAEYVDFCVHKCLSSALKLCDFWSDMLQLWAGAVVEETLVDVSIYQVTQILSSLYHLLPGTGPHCGESLKTTIQRTIQFVANSRTRVSRVSPGLKAAERLVQVLGQVAPETRRSSEDNIHHLPSHGSLIPERTCSDEAEDPERPIQNQAGATADARGNVADDSGLIRPLQTSIAPPAFGGNALGLEEYLDFLPWNTLGAEAVEFYSPVFDG